MIFEQLGSAYGRSVFIEARGTENGVFPAGYSIAAIVLAPGWKAADLGWELNALYGNLEDWNEFAPNAGTRSFAFYGERAEEASNLCDAMAYAWTAGKDAEYDDIMASSHDEATVEEFVENMFSGEILAGERYAGNLQNLIFAVHGGEGADPDLADRVAAAVKACVERHHFD